MSAILANLMSPLDLLRIYSCLIIQSVSGGIEQHWAHCSPLTCSACYHPSVRWQALILAFQHDSPSLSAPLLVPSNTIQLCFSSPSFCVFRKEELQNPCGERKCKEVLKRSCETESRDPNLVFQPIIIRAKSGLFFSPRSL